MTSNGPPSAEDRKGASAPQEPSVQEKPTDAQDTDDCHVLRLYVAGLTTRSTEAVERVREICEEHLKGRYELEVIDIYQLPTLAKGEQIVATPTLIRVLPAPLRRYIGNLSKEKLIFGLDLRQKGTDVGSQE
jgi:circadian clock protein KaiB